MNSADCGREPPRTLKRSRDELFYTARRGRRPLSRFPRRHLPQPVKEKGMTKKVDYFGPKLQLQPKPQIVQAKTTVTQKPPK
jgi:hypothetical protein